MRNINKKAFTLVELIIVITILAILATIAFFSFQWEAWEARNAKRISDINTMEKALELARTKSALNLIQFVTWTASQLNPPPQIAWATWTTNDYKAGTPNFTILWIDGAAIKDPNGLDYSFWVTTKKKWQYQFAATMEWWTSKRSTAFVKWTYSARVWLTMSGSVNPRNNKIFSLSNQSDYWKTFIGDIFLTNEVVEISNDLRSITFKNTVVSWTTSITLWNESLWLIWDYNSDTAPWLTTWTWSPAVPVINWDESWLPY